MIFDYVIILLKSENKDNIIIRIVLLLFIAGLSTLTLNSTTNGVYSLKGYIIFIFIDLLILDYKMFIEAKSLNLFNKEALNFSFGKILFPFLLICLSLGAFSFEKGEESNFFYRLKYDYYYNFDEEYFDYDNYFEKIDYSVFNNYNFIDDYVLPTHVEYQTFNSNDEKFLYGFGKQEDSNGSRWTRKYAAINLYAVKDDNLIINLYNPENHYGLSIAIYINNICYYSDKTKLGSESIKITNAIKTDGNCIVRIVCDDFSGKAIDNEQYAFYVTNIVFTH